jgi:AcrR family transcriptional regulator
MLDASAKGTLTQEFRRICRRDSPGRLAQAWLRRRVQAVARPKIERDPAVTQRILDVALDVMTEYGTAAPMREIARRAGISYGLIYKHFPSQSALLTAATGTQYKRVQQAWLTAQNIDDPIDRIIAMCIAPFELFAEIVGFRSASFMTVIGDPNTKTRVSAIAASATGLFHQAIQQARHEGYFHSLPEDALVRMLIGIPVVYTSDYLVPDEPDWRQLEQDIGRLIRGLAEATRIASAA